MAVSNSLSHCSLSSCYRLHCGANITGCLMIAAMLIYTYIQLVGVLPGIKAISPMLSNPKSWSCAQKKSTAPHLKTFWVFRGLVRLQRKKKRHSLSFSWCLLLLFIDCYIKILNVAYCLAAWTLHKDALNFSSARETLWQSPDHIGPFTCRWFLASVSFFFFFWSFLLKLE